MNTLGIIPPALLAQEVELTVQGTLVMAACVALVLGLNVFCLARILRERRRPGNGDAQR